MNRTTTVVVALIAPAGLSTMVYAVPEQRALAWGAALAAVAASAAVAAVAMAVEEDSSAAAVALAVEEDSSAMDSINILYKQSTRSIIVLATATTNNHTTKTTKTRTKKETAAERTNNHTTKTKRQYVLIQRSTLLGAALADSVRMGLTTEK